MVLEGATASRSDSLLQDAPTSDLDPYASSSQEDQSPGNTQDMGFRSGDTINYSIDTTKLPKVWSLLGPRPISKGAMGGLYDQISFATTLMQRRLRQDEVDAFSYHYARGLRVASIGLPAGMLAGAIAAQRTKEKFGFPFYVPKEDSRFNPDKLLFLKNQSARLAWHAIRLSTYSFLGLVFGSIFFGSYAVSLDAAAKATDPRLKDFAEALRQRMKDGKGMEPLLRQARQNSQVTTQDGQMDSQVLKAQKTIQKNREREPKRNVPVDDMSPTSGSWADENVGTTSDGGLLSDAQMRSEEQRQQAKTESSSRGSGTFPVDRNKSASQPQNSDKASSTTDPTNKYPTGSTWERIRKEAAAHQGQSQNKDQRSVQNEQRQGSTLGDSFSFSESMEEKQSAQPEAQRDFDARVTRERQGGDFNDSNNKKRW